VKFGIVDVFEKLPGKPKWYQAVRIAEGAPQCYLERKLRFLLNQSKTTYNDHTKAVSKTIRLCIFCVRQQKVLYILK
jgi:sugar-specific transcriptional regulator TrmB